MNTTYSKFLSNREKVNNGIVKIEDENKISYYGIKLLKVSFDYKYFNTGIKVFTPLKI